MDVLSSEVPPKKKRTGGLFPSLLSSTDLLLQIPPTNTSLPVWEQNPAVPFPAEKCVEALEMLKAEFGVRFRQLHVNAKEIRLFQNPFVADIDEAQPSYQFELAELQNCDVLKDAFKPNSLIDFYAASQNDTYLT
ncbi:hypothetical protein AAFF_G00096500 [Aldrovandia affinis]|uniref:Uncharacterized protein n=1 Tax=Aldrovandia affinis TaxID=143900 RepID=A0AAD7RVC2_9TELE|nr:hypothetical protein AAFF_G00096500 [Aldrovandia affinis]